VGLAWAEPAPVSAKVVLVREPHVYLALKDPVALRSGDLVTFRKRKRTMASGSVAHVLDGELAVVTLSSGSLTSVKKPERLQVLAERLRLPPLPKLRIGYPAASRTNLLFSCPRVAFLPPLPAGAYRAEERRDRSSRLIRDPAVQLLAPWPETLLVRFFDDGDDEEIALERGELDVAMFWPGELSRHMRDQSRWAEAPYGTRARGLVVAVGLGNATRDSIALAPDAATLERFNRVLFRGDLEPWRDPAAAARPFVPIRFEVDLACPGWREMQRLLDSASAPTSARRARLSYLDAPIATLDSLRARPGVTPLFLLRCPVVCGPELRSYVSALGAGALVDALDCTPVAREP